MNNEIKFFYKSGDLEFTYEGSSSYFEELLRKNMLFPNNIKNVCVEKTADNVWSLQNPNPNIDLTIKRKKILAYDAKINTCKQFNIPVTITFNWHKLIQKYGEDGKKIMTYYRNLCKCERKIKKIKHENEIS